MGGGLIGVASRNTRPVGAPAIGLKRRGFSDGAKEATGETGVKRQGRCPASGVRSGAVGLLERPGPEAESAPGTAIRTSSLSSEQFC